ncbi:hypothetical protein GmHk_01G001490 [Glycine max]|nr:hypothetical protein GmHk_01G001490 [Glycine max]
MASEWRRKRERRCHFKEKMSLEEAHHHRRPWIRAWRKKEMNEGRGREEHEIFCSKRALKSEVNIQMIKGHLWMVNKTPGSATWDLASRSHQLWKTLVQSIEEQGLDPMVELDWKQSGSLLIGRTNAESDMLKGRVNYYTNRSFASKGRYTEFYDDPVKCFIRFILFFFLFVIIL